MSTSEQKQYPAQFWIGITTQEGEEASTTWGVNSTGEKIVGETACFYYIQWQDNPPRRIKKASILFSDPAPLLAATAAEIEAGTLRPVSDDEIDAAQYAQPSRAWVPVLEPAVNFGTHTVAGPLGFAPMCISEAGVLSGQVWNSPVEKAALELAILQFHERQAVAQVRELIGWYPQQRREDDTDGALSLGQFIVFKHGGNNHLKAATVTRGGHGFTPTVDITHGAPVNYATRDLPPLGAEVLAVKLGRLVGGHVVAVDYAKCQVLLCSGYWLTLAEWEIGVTVGYNQGRWFVENAERLPAYPWLAKPDLSAVRRARKARRRYRAQHLTAVLRYVPHINHPRWQVAKALNSIVNNLCMLLGGMEREAWVFNNADKQTIRLALQQISQPKWRQLK